MDKYINKKGKTPRLSLERLTAGRSGEPSVSGPSSRDASAERSEAGSWVEDGVSWGVTMSGGDDLSSGDPLPADVPPVEDDEDDVFIVGESPARRERQESLGGYRADSVTESLSERRQSMLLMKEELDCRFAGLGAVPSPADVGGVASAPPSLAGGLEDDPFLVPVPRKRGRPESTGEWRKKKEAIRRRREEEARRLGLPPPPPDPPRDPRVAEAARRTGEALCAFRVGPTLEVVGRALEGVATVEKVATTSKNLNGITVRRLKEAVSALRAALTVLSDRARPSDTDARAKELEELRGELSSLRLEVIGLRASGERARAEMEALRAAGPLVGDRPPVVNAETQTDRLPAPVRSARAGGRSTSVSAGLDPQPIPAARAVGGGAPARAAAAKGRKKRGGGGGVVAPVGPVPAADAVGRGPDLPPASGDPVPGQTWARVVGRRAGGGKRAAPAARGVAPPQRPGGERVPPPPGKGGRAVPSAGGKRSGGSPTRPSGASAARRVRVPRSAAIGLSCPEGRAAETMRLARDRIPATELADMGVRPGDIKMRRAFSGALLLEVAGEGSGRKADALAARMREELAGEEGVRITRPLKMAEIRVRDLDDSVAAGEIASAVAASGSCEPGQVQVGAIRRGPTGLGSAWIRCPAAAAKKAVSTGWVQVGWARARVELLDERPLLCYRCLQRGHVQQNCSGGPDRRDRCYRCGVPGHRARDCAAPPRCPVCADLGRPADHRVGGAACAPPKKVLRTRGTREGGPALAAPAPAKPSARAGAEDGGGGAAVTADPPTASDGEVASSSSSKRKREDEGKSGGGTAASDPAPGPSAGPAQRGGEAAAEKPGGWLNWARLGKSPPAKKEPAPPKKGVLSLKLRRREPVEEWSAPPTPPAMRANPGLDRGGA